ncbi:RLA class II histocompatibility antigen, DP beta chain-like [Pristis pectinata]|uniref:RLA class II histocompatibility antigen, DP beta chain-like n=1 Tax=Pristis pectinata TaxID=685728 RepID=UPI00223C9914|nr:RLA class II histocompatibility antigen, DP beta chain-like [Pristis pectinata]
MEGERVRECEDVGKERPRPVCVDLFYNGRPTLTETTGNSPPLEQEHQTPRDTPNHDRPELHSVITGRGPCDTDLTVLSQTQGDRRRPITGYGGGFTSCGDKVEQDTVLGVASLENGSCSSVSVTPRGKYEHPLTLWLSHGANTLQSSVHIHQHILPAAYLKRLRLWSRCFAGVQRVMMRFLLLLCTALLHARQEAGVGAHSYSSVGGCRFNSSARGGWTYVYYDVYNHEKIFYFDFAQKKFVAVKGWMQGNVDRWNKDGSAEAKYQGGIRMCENNIPIHEEWVLTRKVEPEITVRPKVSPSHSGQSALLTCHVTGFYPPHIKLTWLKNGAPVTTRAISTDLLSDGDWTYQVEELLQYHPVSGDKYTCQVEHISLRGPKTVDWEVQSSPESERTKIIVGALGFVFGLLILLAGVIMKLRNAKAILDSSSHGPRLMGPAIS